MPQFNQPTKFIPPDSVHADTIWLNYNYLPAKRFNPLDTPELVFFHPDSAVAHFVQWDHVDTGLTHHLERKDTVISQSFFGISPSGNDNGTPILPESSQFQLALSAIALLLFFAGFSTILTTNKTRLQRYFLSIFSTRKFKDYFLEEHPGLLPKMPVVYTLQGILTGCTFAVWLGTKSSFPNTLYYLGFCLAMIAGFIVIPLFRNSLIMALGNIFMIQQEVKKHVFISYLTHTFLALLLLPLAISQAIQLNFINEWMDGIVLVSLALAFGYQLIKLIQNSGQPSIGAFIYIFLYFCTLELLPLMLIYKVVTLTTII